MYLYTMILIEKVPEGVSFDLQCLSKVFRPVYASKLRVKKGFENRSFSIQLLSLILIKDYSKE